MKFKRILKAAVITALLAVSLSGCTRISTPEELLEPPELNLDKKAMKDAMEKFLPENSVLTTLPSLPGIDKKDTFSKADLNSDSMDEILAFYKDNNTKLLGLLVLAQNQDTTWYRLADIKLDSFDVLQYSVEDLNNDGTKEIIIGSYSDDSVNYGRKFTILEYKDKQLREALEMPYSVADIEDMDKDGYKEISVVSPSENISGSSLRIINLINGKIEKLSEISFGDNTDPYAIKIGDIYENQSAVFVDSFAGVYAGRTDIYFFEGKRLVPIKEINGLDLAEKTFPVQTKDVDDDGIMEVGFPFSPPDNQEITDPLKPWVKSYYRINQDATMSLVKQIYEDYKMGFLLEIPDSFSDNYSISANLAGTQIDINYITSDKQAYKLAQIKLISKEEWETTDQVLQIISETSEQVTGGKVEDESSQLSGDDKQQYLKMRSDILNLSNVAKPSGI